MNKDFHCDAILDVGNNDVIGCPVILLIAIIGSVALQQQGEGGGGGEVR